MIQRDNPLRVASSGYIMPPGLTTYNAGSPEAPRLYNGHLLKIPIAWPILAGPNATKLRNSMTHGRDESSPFCRDLWKGKAFEYCATWVKLTLSQVRPASWILPMLPTSTRS